MSEGVRVLLLLSPIFLAGFVVVGLAAVLVPSLLVWWVRRSRVVQEELDGVFLAQGFERVGATLVGTLGGERVSVRRNGDRLQLRVDGLPPGFVVGPRRVRVQDRWRRREGAQLADGTVFLGTPEGLAVASEEVRAALALFAARGQLWVKDDSLRLDLPERALGQALDLAEQLASFLTHLREVEPDLSSVLAGFSPRQRKDAFARAQEARDDGDSARRVAAALLQVDGLAPALAWRCTVLARDPAGLLAALRHGTVQQQQTALRLVPREALCDALVLAVGSDAEAVWRAAVGRVLDAPTAPTVRAVAPLLDRDEVRGEAMASSIVALLEQAPLAPDAFPLSRLRPWLQVDHSALQMLVVARLGEEGTVADVPALRAVEAEASPTVQLAIGQAVRRIQARATGDAGGVALAPSRGGEVAVVASPVQCDGASPGSTAARRSVPEGP